MTIPSNTSRKEWRYPSLAKETSDGWYCFIVQRRISCFITRLCLKLNISANQATLVDILTGLIAALCIYRGFLYTGALFIQIFGIWSCVDGEIARLTGSTSAIGDFYDTMTDRFIEFLIICVLVGSLRQESLHLFFYLGAVFLITISSEKYRSTYQKNYPKKKLERLFTCICAGSDIRLCYISFGIVGWAFLENHAILISIINILTYSLYINFLYRIWIIGKHDAGL